MKKRFVLKEELKSLVLLIHETNHIIRTEQVKRYVGREQNSLRHLQSTFRYKHVAYCMLRGTPFERIESGKAFTNANINTKEVETIMEAYREEDVCALP